MSQLQDREGSSRLDAEAGLAVSRRTFLETAASVAAAAAILRSTLARAAAAPQIVPNNRPIDPDPGGRLVELSFRAYPRKVEVAPAHVHEAWTFEGQVPGPVVRVQEGDVVKFTFTNVAHDMDHSIDFHSALTPWDRDFRDVKPGESIAFYWKASYPGVWMYHCGTDPVIRHIANGMFGAAIVDPKGGRPRAREYVLVQSELFHSTEDVGPMVADTPEFVAFNFYKNRYVGRPLEAAPGELVRIYVVNAGPNRFSAFHVIGGIFERVEVNGNPGNALYGLQTFTVPPGSGSLFEMIFPEPGKWLAVDHSLKNASLGAAAVIEVKENPRNLPLMPYLQPAEPPPGGG